MFILNTLHYFIEKYRNLQEFYSKMLKLSYPEFYNDEGHVNYEKVVEITHLNLKNFLNASLEESFNLAKDASYRAQINDTNSEVRDQALDAYIKQKQIVASEFYVDFESRFYTSHSMNMHSMNNGQIETHSMDTDLIELTLAINELVDRSAERHADLITKITLQLEELSFMTNQDFNVHCLQPQDFYTSIKHCIAPLNISVDGIILISKLLYQSISPNLHDFYLAMHNLLLDVDINPAEENINSSDNQQDIVPVADDAPSNSSIMNMSTGQFFAPVEQELWEQEYGTNNDFIGKE